MIIIFHLYTKVHLHWASVSMLRCHWWYCSDYILNKPSELFQKWGFKPNGSDITQVLVAFFSAARAAFCTSRGPFAHLQRMPLRWRVCDIVWHWCSKWIIDAYGLFTPDGTETGIGTRNKWVVWNCTEAFTLHLNLDRRKDLLFPIVWCQSPFLSRSRYCSM